MWSYFLFPNDYWSFTVFLLWNACFVLAKVTKVISFSYHPNPSGIIIVKLITLSSYGVPTTYYLCNILNDSCCLQDELKTLDPEHDLYQNNPILPSTRTLLTQTFILDQLGRLCILSHCGSPSILLLSLFPYYYFLLFTSSFLISFYAQLQCTIPLNLALGEYHLSFLATLTVAAPCYPCHLPLKNFSLESKHPNLNVKLWRRKIAHLAVLLYHCVVESPKNIVCGWFPWFYGEETVNGNLGRSIF